MLKYGGGGNTVTAARVPYMKVGVQSCWYHIVVVQYGMVVILYDVTGTIKDGVCDTLYETDHALRSSDTQSLSFKSGQLIWYG